MPGLIDFFATCTNPQFAAAAKFVFLQNARHDSLIQNYGASIWLGDALEDERNKEKHQG